jgi:predicted CXXCH cytochrome family protein
MTEQWEQNPFAFSSSFAFWRQRRATGRLHPPPPLPSANPAVGKDVCLGGHGPFHKPAAALTTFTEENGDKVNPHRYVPHNRADDKAVVECAKCHSPHPLPLASKPGLPEANPDWCYSCYHTQEFFPCKNCHQ